MCSQLSQKQEKQDVEHFVGDFFVYTPWCLSRPYSPHVCLSRCCAPGPWCLVQTLTGDVVVVIKVATTGDNSQHLSPGALGNG